MRKLLYALLLAPLLALGSQQVINVGSSPNDHTGDTVRAAFIKDNANVAELYLHATAYNVVALGAHIDGTGLATTTAAIQAAVTAACANVHGNASGGVIELPPGEYLSGPIIQPCAQVYWRGTGRGAVKITFVPTGDTNPTALASGVADPGTWLTIANSTFTSSQPTISFYGGMSDLRISTDDLTHKKNAIYQAETSQFDVEHVVIDKFWGNNSAGIRVAGHEFLNVHHSYISATVPVWVNRGLVAYSGTRYNDFMAFTDVVLRAPHGSDPATYYPSGLAGGVPNTCFLIDDGVFISNFTMDRVSWVGGANAVYWKQATSASALSYYVSITHGRKEQSGGTFAPADPIIGLVFDFTGSATRLNNLSLENVYISGSHTDSGVYAHAVNNLLMKDFEVNGYTSDGLFVMDVDNVYTIKWINVDAGAATLPATINMGANLGTSRNCTYRQNFNLPRNCEWTFESSPRVAKTLAAGTTSNLTTVFGVSSDIGGFDFPRGVRTIIFTTTAGAATLTGLPAPDTTAGLFEHAYKVDLMVANGGNKLTLPYHSGSETNAAQQWETAAATDTDILPGQKRTASYDSTLSKWTVQ